jgi:hypothetical protein
MRRLLAFLFLLALVSTTASAQVREGTSLPVIRDQDALNTVQAAITALGGAAAIGTVQSWQAQGQAQGVAPDGKTVSGTVTWEMAGSELRMASSTNLGQQALLTGHGNPAMVGSGTSMSLPAHVITATFIPALVSSILLNRLQNSNCAFQYVGPQSLGQESVTVVKTVCLHVANYVVTAQTWYFDAASSLPVRVEFRRPSMTRPQLAASGAVGLSNYQQVSGVLYPFQILAYEQGKQTGTVTLQTVNVNPAIPASDFDPPTGGAQ